MALLFAAGFLAGYAELTIRQRLYGVVSMLVVALGASLYWDATSLPDFAVGVIGRMAESAIFIAPGFYVGRWIYRRQSRQTKQVS